MFEADLTPDKFDSIVLYEDNHILGLYKPAGLLVQGDRTGRVSLLNLAKEYIKMKYHKPGRVFIGLVHRLDRQVAGAVVLARTSKAAGRLSAQFRTHTARKIYWAAVHGRPKVREANLDMHLVRRGRKSVAAAPLTPGARPARLSYSTIDTWPRASLLEINLETGRRHQIRAQLAALGHPILGDRLYGSTCQTTGQAIGLLARSLTIKHPTRDHEITLTAPPEGHIWPMIELARSA
jgi:23S rRNA pseudouridine1911/1915/1917 synthase